MIYYIAALDFKYPSAGVSILSTNYQSDMTTDEKVLISIVRAAEVFKRVVSVVFRNYGLSFPQYNVLRALDASTDGKNRISDVSHIMLVPTANMTGLAKRLERSGFIIRKSDPADERVTILEITPKERKTLRNIEQERHESDKAILKGFSEEERNDLLEKIVRIVQNSLELATGTGIEAE